MSETFDNAPTAAESTNRLVEEAFATLDRLAHPGASPESQLASLASLFGAGYGHTDTVQQRQLTAEAKYQALVEQIPAVTFMAPLDGSTSELYVSPQIRGLLGFSPQEWLEARSCGTDSFIPTTRSAGRNSLPAR